MPKPKARRRKPTLERYAARLLFQYRFLVGAQRRTKRLCEERIIVIKAPSALAALQVVNSYGRKGQFTVRTPPASPFRYEFVGVRELLHLGLETESIEMWYEIRTLLSPSERRSKLIPKPSALQAVRYERARSNNALQRTRYARR
jgi:Domain of unknown function (DUF4288)